MLIANLSGAVVSLMKVGQRDRAVPRVRSESSGILVVAELKVHHHFALLAVVGLFAVVDELVVDILHHHELDVEQSNSNRSASNRRQC